MTMREALEKIAELPHDDYNGAVRCACCIARAALAAQPECQKCGHPNHESQMHQGICTFYVPSMGAECGCNHPQKVAAQPEADQPEALPFVTMDEEDLQFVAASGMAGLARRCGLYLIWPDGRSNIFNISITRESNAD